MRITKMYLHRMEVLLHSFPFLKQLILNVGTRENHNLYRKNHALEENYWRSETGSFKCLNQNVEKVEIIGFDASNPNWYQSRNLVEVAQFLLDNAKVLQKLTIHGKVYDICRPLDPLEAKKLKNLLEMKEDVLQYPRASPNAVVVFETGQQ